MVSAGELHTFPQSCLQKPQGSTPADLPGLSILHDKPGFSGNVGNLGTFLIGDETDELSLDIGQKRGDDGGFPLDLQFHASLGQVAHESGDGAANRDPMRRGPEADSLHATVIEDVNAVHGFLPTNTRSPGMAMPGLP